MRKKFVPALFLLGVCMMAFSINANASGCKPNAITATSRITGTMRNTASRPAFMQAAMNQMFRKWTEAATSKHGPEYKYHKIKDCVCRVNSLALKTGGKLKIDCKFTAYACVLVHYNEGIYKCGLFNKETNKLHYFRFKR